MSHFCDIQSCRKGFSTSPTVTEPTRTHPFSLNNSDACAPAHTTSGARHTFLFLTRQVINQVRGPSKAQNNSLGIGISMEIHTQVT